MDPFGWNFFSKDNFRFYSYTNADLNTTEYNAPVSAVEHGVDSITI